MTCLALSTCCIRGNATLGFIIRLAPGFLDVLPDRRRLPEQRFAFCPRQSCVISESPRDIAVAAAVALRLHADRMGPPPGPLDQLEDMRRGHVYAGLHRNGGPLRIAGNSNLGLIAVVAGNLRFLPRHRRPPRASGAIVRWPLQA